ncbi:hypothetical protein KC19_5G107600 [Ceratodon purpureus]|uniref:Solute carrier family 25 member 44 n=1 Tax=Ceratodon purpureus TaxID=3225 RepID=A0A8T0I105_CERPU|nr:hypothetical protein KC19_5G107600 [Ceratodon purpureus]
MAAVHDRRAAAGVALPQAEINWDRLDKTKFFLVGAGLFSGVSALLYPVSVVKTRMQVARADALHTTGPAIFKHILRSEGVLGLYRGFGVVISGAIPSRIVFMTTLETTKASTLKLTEKLDVSEATAAAMANGLGGLCSSLASQSVFVPIDVVSQRLMVQGTPGAHQYKGSMDAIRTILRTDGVRGFYRGFGMSVLTYSPSNAVWWAAYGSSQRVIWRYLGYGGDVEKELPSTGEVVLVQALGGVIAGASSSIATTPMDTVKTRLQVLVNEGDGRPTIKQTVKKLLKEEGWRGFYKGLGPRFFSMSLWGTSMITTYEFLSMPLSPLASLIFFIHECKHRSMHLVMEAINS